MADSAKSVFLKQLSQVYGRLDKLGRSQSLYAVGDDAARLYIRYSKVHGGQRTFYGLRREDLHQLEGRSSFICFLWDDQAEPLLVPFPDYEALFQSISPASDGQYKVQVYPRSGSTELYVAQAGRFNVEGNFGWRGLEKAVGAKTARSAPDLSHSQVQTLLGAIGAAKGYDVWVPTTDRGKFDWSVAAPFSCRDVLPYGFEAIKSVIKEIDVIWTRRGSSKPNALFEVEHSTSIYSGLLRFNDVHLTAPRLLPRFGIVADDARREVFARHLNRPTFRSSGLTDLCAFIGYVDVFDWHNRIVPPAKAAART